MGHGAIVRTTVMDHGAMTDAASGGIGHERSRISPA
jgi:hypothetical protein